MQPLDFLVMPQLTLFPVFFPRVRSAFHGGFLSVLPSLETKSAPIAIGYVRGTEWTGFNINVPRMWPDVPYVLPVILHGGDMSPLSA